MLDSEETRNFLRPAVELEMLISNFADAYGKGSAHDERLASSAKAVVTLLKSWPGMFACLFTILCCFFLISPFRSIVSLCRRKESVESSRRISSVAQ